MKKIIVLFLTVLSCFILVSCIDHAEADVADALKTEDIIGTWRCELYGSDLTIEFTDDGYFISHTDGTKNRYKIDEDCIVTFVEGVAESSVSVEAKIVDGKLIYGSVEYTKVEN